jgi:hypothetical protein
MHLLTSLLNAKGCASTRMVVVAEEAARTSRELRPCSFSSTTSFVRVFRRRPHVSE